MLAGELRFDQADDSPVAVSFGAGELGTVVFLHGFAEIWYMWRHQMLAVAAAGYRAVSPDWPGYGLSDQPPQPKAASYNDLVEDLLAILDALSIPKPSPFFTEQLTAFEVWLGYGSEEKKPPEQLPIVLQVMLSQSHRLRALVLLGRFLDMGPWAVDLALSVGIFPYVLKLLQTSAMELRQILVFIWTKNSLA